MADTIQTGADALLPELREQVNFFADEDRQNFIDPETLRTVAVTLLTLFMSGMVGEIGKTVGHEVGAGIVVAVKRVLHGQKPDPAVAEKTVQAARDALATVPAAERPGFVAAVQADMRDQLSEVLPDNAAVALAAQISDQATKVVAHV